MAASKIGAGVSPNQLAILRALEQYPEEGLTKKQIHTIAKVPCSNFTLGPAYLETLKGYPNCLWGKGLVTAHQLYEDDKAVTIYTITQEGLDLVGTLRTKRYSTHYGRIPGDILNPIVVEYAKTCTYGHDGYRDRDLNYIRSKLPQEYHYIDNHNLHAQIIAQRKKGAYKRETPIHEWLQEYRDSLEFLAKQDECLEKWNGECAINNTHEGDILAYHRRLTVVVAEEDGGGEHSILEIEDIEHNDLIPLCEDCAKRLRVSLVKFPEEKPTTYYET